MDSGSWHYSFYKLRSRLPFHDRFIRNDKIQDKLDRFIPNRSAMDFDYAHYMLTEGPKEIENPVVPFASTVAYWKRLAEALNLNRTRILAFKNKIPERIELIPKDYLSPFPQSRSDKPMRYIPQSPEKTLDAPGLLKDLSLNLLDWGSSNVISIGLENSVFLWNALDSSSTELVTVEEEMGPVTSVSWAPDGRLLAVGLNNSHVQLWDSTTSRLIRILDGHEGRVGSLAWNDHILTTAGKDKKIFNNDIRVGSHVVETYRGHQQEICGLKWAPSGKLLTSGGNDNLVHIWDRSLASSNSTTRWLHRFNDHRAAVKALAWCPFNNYLLASWLPLRQAHLCLLCFGTRIIVSCLAHMVSPRTSSPFGNIHPWGRWQSSTVIPPVCYSWLKVQMGVLSPLQQRMKHSGFGMSLELQHQRQTRRSPLIISTVSLSVENRQKLRILKGVDIKRELVHWLGTIIGSPSISR